MHMRAPSGVERVGPGERHTLRRLLSDEVHGLGRRRVVERVLAGDWDHKRCFAQRGRALQIIFSVA